MLAIGVDTHYGLAGGELPGVAVGFFGESYKKLLIRSRKDGWRSTITAAGASGFTGHWNGWTAEPVAQDDAASITISQELVRSSLPIFQTSLVLVVGDVHRLLSHLFFGSGGVLGGRYRQRARRFGFCPTLPRRFQALALEPQGRAHDQRESGERCSAPATEQGHDRAREGHQSVPPHFSAGAFFG